MKYLIALLALVISPAFAGTQTITITWTNPTTNVDGSPLATAPTFNIYQGLSASGPWTQIDNSVSTSGVHETVDFSKGECFTLVTIEPAPAIPSVYAVPYCFPSQPNAATNVAGTSP